MLVDLVKKLIEEKKISTLQKDLRKITLNIDELPSAALEIAYIDLMKKYEQKQETKFQEKLILISKILNDRAYQEGNNKPTK